MIISIRKKIQIKIKVFEKQSLHPRMSRAYFKNFLDTIHSFLSSFFNLLKFTENASVTIGDVTKQVKSGSNPEYVPRKYRKSYN